ncbi:MAG: hypothetical protein GHCLOJNM_02922 [bacterium]|nr:hypothetical protein [bacterium]
MDPRRKTRGFTLIELLIVIAIILILIAIALPNFLEAQVRAKVTRENTDMRSLATGIESLRTDRDGMLLVDFWDDDIGVQFILARFGGGCAGGRPATFRSCCCWQGHDMRGGTSGMFFPLTSPVKYLTEVPQDPFFEREDVSSLISEDRRPPVSYMYLDRETRDGRFGSRDDEFRGAHRCWSPNGRDGCTQVLRQVAPLRADSYVLIGHGPDGRRDAPYDIPYSPTNGTRSAGDTLFRSDGGVNLR